MKCCFLDPGTVSLVDFLILTFILLKLNTHQNFRYHYHLVGLISQTCTQISKNWRKMSGQYAQDVKLFDLRELIIAVYVAAACKKWTTIVITL